MVLFNSFTCLSMFSCTALRDLCVSSLRASIYLPVFSCISLRELFMSLKSSIIIMRYDINLNLAFPVCWGILVLLWWKNYVLMMQSILGFCCLCSCPYFLLSGYLRC
jgi:hypothetical protein